MANQGSEEALVVLRAVLAFGRRLRAERPISGVTLAELSILAALERLGPVPARQLAEEERLQPQSLTRMISSLDRKNLISRSRSEEDHREIIIALSKHGRTVLIDDLRARKEWLDEVMASTLTGSERAQLLAGCTVMLALASHADDGA